MNLTFSCSFNNFHLLPVNLKHLGVFQESTVPPEGILWKSSHLFPHLQIWENTAMLPGETSAYLSSLLIVLKTYSQPF